MEKFILAIDQGTTSTRAILFNHQREIVATSQKEIKQYYPQPGWVEQDGNEIWITTLAVIADVILKSEIQPNQVAAIGISNQRETTLVWDKKTGLPLYRALVWQSRQSDTICEEWKQNGWEEIVAQKTGLRIDPYFSASKIRWILDNVEGIQEKADNDEVMFGTVDSWLVYKLSGNKTHITDLSNASRTMLCNIHTKQWDEQLLAMFGIPLHVLPNICSTSQEYTKTATYLFFNEEIPITCVVGDQQAALFGQGCFFEGMVKNTYGTGGFVLMNTGKKPYMSKNGLLATVAWDLSGEVTYALEGSIFVSGSLIKWLRDGLQLITHASQTQAMAQAVDDNNGVYIVPAFVGLGAPYWQPNCRGTIVGLTQGVNANHIVRAALEAMAYQSKDVIEAMQQDTNIHIQSLKVDGGAVSNDFLLQFQSDLLQIDVERFQFNELTALGAASLAGLAINYWTMEDFKNQSDHIFSKNKEAKEMDQLYAKWKQAINACRQF